MVLEALIGALIFGGLVWFLNAVGFAGFEAVMMAVGIIGLVWFLIR